MNVAYQKLPQNLEKSEINERNGNIKICFVFFFCNVFLPQSIFQIAAAYCCQALVGGLDDFVLEPKLVAVHSRRKMFRL